LLEIEPLVASFYVVPKPTEDTVYYRDTHHLFNSAGEWIGFCLAHNVFDTDTVWCGWFPWDNSADVVATNGVYLGTVVSNRLYSFEHKRDMGVAYYPSYPAIPVLPNTPKPVAARKLPLGASDVTLKPPTPMPSAAGRQHRRRRRS
jgi:hypothetical protein